MTQAPDQGPDDYSHFKRALYDSLREKFERELGPLPDKDLEPWRSKKVLSRLKHSSMSWRE